MPAAFVTGASRGVGKAIASALTEAGFDLTISARTVKPGEARDNAVSLLESPDAAQYIGTTVDAQDERYAMAVRPTVTDSEGFGKELLAASPDLLGSMVKAFAEALMNAEVDEICNAEYGEVSPERVNRRTDTGRSSVSTSCPARTAPAGWRSSGAWSAAA